MAANNNHKGAVGRILWFIWSLGEFNLSSLFRILPMVFQSVSVEEDGRLPSSIFHGYPQLGKPNRTSSINRGDYRNIPHVPLPVCLAAKFLSFFSRSCRSSLSTITQQYHLGVGVAREASRRSCLANKWISALVFSEPSQEFATFPMRYICWRS